MPTKAEYQKEREERDAQIASMPFATLITKALLDFGTERNGTKLPARSNFDPLFAEAFMWDYIAKYAKNKSDSAWARLEGEGAIVSVEDLEPGNHEIGSSPTFTTNVKISQPINRFDPSVLAKTLKNSKHKVPETFTLQAIEKSKVPKTSSKTLTIEERGVPTT